METTDELRGFLAEMVQPDLWGQLIARGSAWSLMRQGGVLPQGAPAFGPTIETDLTEHGFSVLRAALALRELREDPAAAKAGFERAANAFEALIRNGDIAMAERGLLRTLAAASYHLADFSAIAYSIFADAPEDLNNSPAERAIAFLILRDLSAMRRMIEEWLRDATHSDDAVAAGLEDGTIDTDDAVQIILNTSVCRALAYFDFALQIGDVSFVERAIVVFDQALKLATDAASVPLWWTIRICRSMITDLWQQSLHQNLPTAPPTGGEENYEENRRLFIASLYSRRSAEVELWPSQREAAVRSTDLSDDLVVALPTSAGKTRVAEIAALMTLSTGKRVLIVTPLRALSAQTERSFRRTFAPLGFAVSSLYGASGVSEGDEDALRSRPIVIATPEKLDFALRSDPSIIDDVGLVVLDEGHLIGPSEREIRYEILVQRLLRRGDANDRRIVCLSAILPDGDALDDLTAWMRSDEPGDPVRSKWRPTRQRFGSIVWGNASARLGFDLNADGPFVAKFIERVAPRGREQLPYPRETKDLTIFSAWRFAEQGKRTLIFITQANWVEGFGNCAVDLVRRGYLPSLIADKAPLARALEVGREWLGPDHPAVKAMAVGVAIHHGKLPKPFLREMELLLGEGVLKVIVASPTLSQGLNLNAAVLLVPYLVRSGQEISGEEFANVAGRAGRAFVDVEGLVAHVIYDNAKYRLRRWAKLVASARSRDLQSGLYQVINEVLERLSEAGRLDDKDAFEFLANAREAWTLEDAANGSAASEEDDEDADDSFTALVEKLDAMVFGLVEALDSDSADLPRLLDEALNGSLWARKIARSDDDLADRHKAILSARAQLIWANTTPQTRRGHFAMGVGLEAGLALDEMADELADLLDKADESSISGDAETLGDVLVSAAEKLLAIRPFVPNDGLPAGWKKTLRKWVSGVGVDMIGTDKMKTVEDAFAYRLVWALEAIRTRRVAAGWSPELIAGGGAAAAETGVPNFMMSMLIRAGLPSRQAAIAAVNTANPVFVDSAGLREWLLSDEVAVLSQDNQWPTPETAALWRRFRDEVTGASAPMWKTRSYTRKVELGKGQARPVDGIYRVELDKDTSRAWIVSPDLRRIAPLRRKVADSELALYRATFAVGEETVRIERLGPGLPVWDPV